MFPNYRMQVLQTFGAVAAVFCTLALTACASHPVTYTKESFSVDSPYQKKVGVGAATACEGARRALLGDGYVIDKANSDNVTGRKAYHSEGDRSTFIEMSVVCVPDPAGSSLYANGLLSTYDVKKSAASASVGVSALGSLSLPIGQSADSMVKTSDETINDRGFYQRFFTAVDAVLVDIKPETPPTARPEAGRGTTPEVLKTKAQDAVKPSAVVTPPTGTEAAQLAPLSTQNGTASGPPPVTPQNPSVLAPLSTVPLPAASATTPAPSTVPAAGQAVPPPADAATQAAQPATTTPDPQPPTHQTPLP